MHGMEECLVMIKGVGAVERAFSLVIEAGARAWLWAPTGQVLLTRYAHSGG